MKILIIGSGGREHAIGWKIKNDNPDVSLFFSVGNAGTAEIGENIGTSDLNELLDFALVSEIDLTIVGPEMELVDGIVDLFQSNGLKIFGADQKAAELEGSKVFAKNFMQKYNVKTPFYKTFKHFVDARDYIDGLEDFPVVIKASGLAAGKGVVIVNNKDEALQVIREMMNEKSFGEAGTQVVIEQFIQGFECSILSIFNGKEITPFISAKDHKKIGEGETGLNTGGMGVIAPNLLFDDQHFEAFKNQILLPTQNGLLNENLNFAGIIFFGLIVNENGVYLLEYNMRFGDPETEAILPLMESNLLDKIERAIQGETIEIQWKNQHACCVVLASGGYPLNYEKGFEIRGLNNVEVPVFIAGAKKSNDKIIPDGGRVLNVVGLGNSLDEARKSAYDNVAKIHFDFEYFRKDIGQV